MEKRDDIKDFYAYVNGIILSLLLCEDDKPKKARYKNRPIRKRESRIRQVYRSHLEDCYLCTPGDSDCQYILVCGHSAYLAKNCRNCYNSARSCCVYYLCGANEG